ncbi:MAG: glycosyltransferase family 4 protein [Lachnospiraceae bacterium]|nr:glycosyltransferase family 4 protein [Lachnospiraceae bacterium]
MTITFISNYINHHQLPFCDALSCLLGDGFCFVQTEAMEEERLKMGWSNTGEKRTYVRQFAQEEEQILALINDSDIVLAGWFEEIKIENAVQARIKNNKIVFRSSERIYRSGRWKFISPRGLIRKFKEHTRHRNKNYYLLCAGAYVADDFRLVLAYPGKKYRWGYFPKTVSYGEELWRQKNNAKAVKICWAGRFIPLKHPEYMIRLASDLKKRSHSFMINMIGAGDSENDIKKQAFKSGVLESMTFHGACPPEKVRAMMESSHIHVFTSDYREGWGAVLNEAMNSGCAVVASEEAGATRYLVTDGVNGFSYPNNKYEKMRDLVLELIENPGRREKMGRNAYKTITETWNAEKAAGELVRVCNDVLRGGDIVPAKEGPLSIHSNRHS